MAKQVTDEEASLKRQARRRLIGAVALVTAVAVILPMVLDSEPKPAGVDIELRIPDKDKVAAFQPQQTPVAASASQPVSAPVAVEPTGVPDTVAMPAPVTEPAAQPARQEAQPVVKQESKPAAKPEQKSEPKAEPKSESKPEAKPEAKPAGKSDASPAAKPESASGKSSFVLQVGAYANAEIAKDWQVKLKKQGFHAYTEPAGARTRLRVGPYATREAADTVRQKLSGLGLHPDLLDIGSK